MNVAVEQAASRPPKHILRQVIGGLFLIAWVPVAIASLMSLAGAAGDAPVHKIAIARVFCVGSLLYPAVYLAGIVLHWVFWYRRDATWSRRCVNLPLVYVAFVGALLVLWAAA